MKLSTIGLAITLTTALSLLAPISLAYADSGSRTYNYLIGTDFLCSLDPSACPAISMADNGDTISIAGSGTFSLRPFAVTGSGTFTHKNSAGTVLGAGTWVAMKLIAFHSFGDATPQGLPSNLEGGQLVVQVQLLVNGTPVFKAVLGVDCELGKVPPGQSEGITLSVQEAINFNKKVSGFTVFVRT